MWQLPVYQDLTDDQKAVIDLPLNESHLITGPPGSGKSVMAVYRAQALSRLGEPTMLLMYNRMLRLYTEGALTQLGVENSAVSTYHSWFPRWFRSVYGEEPPMVDQWMFDWDGCIGIAGRNPPPDHLRHHVIVDEGQDMPQKFYLFLRAITRSITVFADEHQILHDENSTNEDIRSAAGISQTASLRKNFRNTRSIATVSGHFWTGVGSPPVELRDSAEDGDTPVLDCTPDLNPAIQWIANFEQSHSTEQIGVLLPYARQVSQFYNKLDHRNTENPVQMYLSEMDPSKRRVEFATDGIKILTYNSAKGLEFDTVFLPELQAYNVPDATAENFRMKMYVLTSRAKKELWLYYSGEGEPRIVETLPLGDLDDWR